MYEILLTLARGLLFFAGYVNSPGTFPEPLPIEEETEAILKAAKGDIEARNKLVEHNLRLVAHIAKKYASNGREQDDLISIGTIGLIKGVTTYNPQKGFSLATYASKCIDNAILSQRNKRRLRRRNGCLLRQNGACWREWESAAIF